MPISKEHMWVHVYELSQSGKSKETLISVVFIGCGLGEKWLVECDKSTKVDCVGRNIVYVWETIGLYI